MSSLPSSRRPQRWYWLLLVPCVAVLLVPSYNRIEPSLYGVPFFYWYQLLWVPLSALVTGIVYAKTTGKGA
jgi:Protein of unknown function (DUF3311)